MGHPRDRSMDLRRAEGKATGSQRRSYSRPKPTQRFALGDAAASELIGRRETNVGFAPQKRSFPDSQLLTPSRPQQPHPTHRAKSNGASAPRPPSVGTSAAPETG